MEGGGQLVEEPRKMIVESLPSMPELRANTVRGMCAATREERSADDTVVVERLRPKHAVAQTRRRAQRSVA
jgi:hypothetical protein